MKSSSELFHKAQERANDEMFDEIVADLKMNSLLGCVFIRSECCREIEKYESVISLLERDWEETRPETNKFTGQIEEAEEEWIKVLDSLDEFTKKTRLMLSSS
jgi:hypothetical protein